LQILFGSREILPRNVALFGQQADLKTEFAIVVQGAGQLAAHSGNLALQLSDFHESGLPRCVQSLAPLRLVDVQPLPFIALPTARFDL
jgi:hypothetical protein